MSTFATLSALQLVIADALDDIQRVFSQNSCPDPPSSPPSQCSSPVYPSSPDPSLATSPFPATPPASFPPTPLSATFPSTQRSPPNTDVPFVDYPSPDSPFVSNSASEQLALHPDAAAAASRIVAACGQMSSIVHKPFSSLCDAIMSVCTFTSMLCPFRTDVRPLLHSGAYMRDLITVFVYISTTFQHVCALLNTFTSRKFFGKLKRTDSAISLVDKKQ
jgi:hypothetical protein